MASIFTASTDLGSPRRTSRIITPLLRWMFPDIQQITINHVQTGFRKGGHALGYAALAVLVWNGLWQTRRPGPNGWDHALARRAVLISAAYAASDEFHQSFVPSRGASVWDVALDTVGAALGICLLWWMGRRWKKW